MRMLRAESKNDSPMNCLIKSLWLAPVAFLTPISMALLDALAVARFMKLIHAIIWIKSAIRSRILRNEALTGTYAMSAS